MTALLQLIQHTPAVAEDERKGVNRSGMGIDATFSAGECFSSKKCGHVTADCRLEWYQVPNKTAGSPPVNGNAGSGEYVFGLRRCILP